MNTVRKFAQNSFFIFISEILVRIIGFFVTLMLVRYLGSADFGKYSLIYAFTSFFQIFLAMWIEPIVVRELSKSRQKGESLIYSAISFKIFFSLLGLLLCWFLLQWIDYPADLKFLIYVSSLGMLLSFGTLFNGIFQVKLLMKYLAIATVIMKILFAVFTVLLIFLKAKLFYFVLLGLVIYAGQVFFIYCLAARVFPVRMTIDFKVWAELLRDSWPLAVNTIFMSIYTRADQVILFHMKGSNELGFYAAAVKLAELPVIFAGAFAVSAFPLLFRYAQDSSDKFRKIYEISFKYMMIFIIPIAMIVTFYAKQIIVRGYGADFLPSSPALAILIWSTVVLYLGLIHNGVLIAVNLQHFDMIFTGFVAIMNAFLNLILIPPYGFVGAALATTISYGLSIPLSCILPVTRNFGLAMVKSMIKPLLAAFLSGYLVYSLSSLPAIPSMLLSGLIYLPLIFLLKAIDANDLRYMRMVFTDKNP